jgi:hypothetical protein
LACGEKCNAFFILAGSLADPEVFICNEYMMQEKRRQIANDANALPAPCKQTNTRIGDVLGNFDLQVKHHFALQQSSLPLTIVYRQSMLCAIKASFLIEFLHHV